MGASSRRKQESNLRQIELMNQHIVAARFTGQLTAQIWRRLARPAIVLTRLRFKTLLGTLESCSYRRAGGFVVATLILACASQVMSPAALPLQVDRVIAPEAPAPMTAADRVNGYAWLSKAQQNDYVPLAEYLVVPAGFQRVEESTEGFADWLRHLPIAPVGTPVTAWNGKVVLSGEDAKLAAVIALQPRSARLLAGPNMLLRLRAEYEWSTGSAESIAFHLTSGHLVAWKAWAKGVRPVIDGREVSFKETGLKDDSRSNFCAYLETLFNCTSALSLLDDTRPVENATLTPGDVFLTRGRGSQPLMVLDVATDSAGEVRVLLGRGGVPAQTFHVLRGADGSPWFSVTQRGSIEFDGQTYDVKHLRRWVW
jgi:hypothetical protein